MSESGSGSLDAASGRAVAGSGSLDAASGVLLSLGVLAGVVELFYRPFLFAPVGFVIVLAGALTSAKYRRLGLVAIFVVAVCFIIGAAIAVWRTRALY